MKRPPVSLLLGLLVLACSAVDSEGPFPSTASDAGGAMGGFPNGGSPSPAGASTGGTFVRSGGWTSGGTNFSMAGTSGGPLSAGGAGGNAENGSAAGAANAAGEGSGDGAGMAGDDRCVGVTIPAKTKWKATALESAAGDPPEKVLDGDNTTRFSTGDPQDGDEWLEIDFGEPVTLNEITLHTNNNDYFRHYQLRLSDEPRDFGASILHEDDGKTGSIVVALVEAHAGRYLTIRQTGMVSPTWWSLHEVSVACR